MTLESGSNPPPHKVEELLRPHRKALAALVRSPALGDGDVDRALAQLTRVAVEVLRVERASVWRFDDAKSRIECKSLFERSTERHSASAVIERKDAPRYFDALATERTIAADDAKTDPRTNEFAAGYLTPLGIVSMLDAPIFVGGEMVGVVCNEHVGPPRTWKLWEELVAGTLADFAAQLFAVVERIRAQRELDVYRANLEALVAERTSRLTETEAGLRKLFEAAPISLVLSKRSDAVVTMANERAAAMFDVPLEEVVGQHAPNYWVDPEDRVRLGTKVAETGHVQGLEARLQTRTGKAFWAQISAQLVTFDGAPSLLLGVHDVSAQKRAEEALRKHGETLETLFAAAPMPLVLTGLDDGIVRYCNRRAADMFDTKVADVVGRRAPDFYANPEDRNAFVERLRSSGRVDSYEVQLRTVTGRSFWALMSSQAFELQGERVFMVGFSDLTHQKRIEEQLRELATKDSLTGVYNRRSFFEMAEKELLRAERYGRPVSLAMLDVDHFKRVNDTFGHATGDQVLVLLAKTTCRELRNVDVFARYGGEEFVILMPETDATAAEAVARRVREAIAAQTFTTASGPRTFTVSVGVATRTDREPLVDALKRADDALYAAKAQGRNRVVVA